MGLWSFHHSSMKQSISKLACRSSIWLGLLLLCFAITTTDGFSKPCRNDSINIKDLTADPLMLPNINRYWMDRNVTAEVIRFGGRLPDLFVAIFCSYSFAFQVAYDAFDPTGNITIKWDVLQWTPDGYTAVVSIFNFQQYRHIQAPGWTLGWTWAKREVIWSMMGAQPTDQGDCSRYKGNIPHCCKKDPTVVDLPPGTPYNMQIANCCRGGVINSWAQDPATAVSSFQLSVGAAGTSNRTVEIPQNFTLKAPGLANICGAAKIVKPTRFLSQDGRRVTQALMTWNVICIYSQLLSKQTPTCCVSLSSFYNDTIIPCPTCACSCQNRTQSESCVKGDLAISKPRKKSAPLVQCTNHMCPIRVHWHVKLNNKEYWRVKISVTNLNYGMNSSMWNLVVLHPNFDNLAKVFSFNYKSLNPYEAMNDTAMLWGIKFRNDLLMQAGPSGHVQSDLLFRKEPGTFTSGKGWAFPRLVYFNGDKCIMPPPDSYPWLSNPLITTRL